MSGHYHLVSLNYPNGPNTPKKGRSQLSDDLYTWVREAKFGIEDYGLLYVYPCSWLWLFGSSIPKLLWCPKYASTGITQPSDVL